MNPWLPWVLLPAVGALIGFATNALAIRMLFRPRERRFGMQGLLPRRQEELAATIAETVARELVRIDRLLAGLDDIDLGRHLAPAVDEALRAELATILQVPLVSKVLTDSRLGSVRDAVIGRIESHRGPLLAAVKRAAAEHLDVEKVVRDRLEGVDVAVFEDLVRRIARAELRAIEWWGALLGAVVGVAQAALLATL